jgi:hypothetical protein
MSQAVMVETKCNVVKACRWVLEGGGGRSARMGYRRQAQSAGGAPATLATLLRLLLLVHIGRSH